MDQGIAALWAAGLGIAGAISSGVLSFRAGRRQVQDQASAEHAHWLRQQRQEAYIAFLSVCDAHQRKIEETWERADREAAALGSLGNTDEDVHAWLGMLPFLFESAERQAMDRVEMLGPPAAAEAAWKLDEALGDAFQDLRARVEWLVHQSGAARVEAVSGPHWLRSQVRMTDMRAALVECARDILSTPKST
ncbi:hypothetical protein [Streptomyces sp. NBC_00120]|uniref:hypothetical protein n=1 Tax=Streptomyces sp. NBC_00120 TaxID=2975660 RepID=UPI00224EEF11|nr:hypothetical protein [Streptomyces sp. NBC_00120]MCX5326300.1 hypothetical protein [Streptomyces sp. NBC_00120]